MRSRALPSFALALALVLSACAELRWQKAGGDEATLNRDLGTCRQLAQERAARMGNFGLPPSTDPRFGSTGPSQVDQRLQERQAEDACMRGKGYTLVPADK
jgi:hypothetical protein